MIFHNRSNLCLHNLETQITITILHIKKFCSYCHITNHSISACFKKQRDDEDKRDAFARSKSPQKLFVQAFVLLPRTEHNDMIHDLEVEVHHEISITTKVTIHKTDIAPHLETDLVMTRVLLLHNTLDHDMTIIKEIRDPIVLLTDLLTDPLKDVTPVTDIDHFVFKRYQQLYKIHILS